MVEERTLENLEVGDIVSKGTLRHNVMIVTPDSYGLVRQGEGNTIYCYTYTYLKQNEWTVVKPLSQSEKVAKKLLEAVGFRVTR